MYFSWATDLDPKGVNSQIKEAISSPGQGDEESPAPQSGNFVQMKCFVEISVDGCLQRFHYAHVDEQQLQNNSMEQEIETNREGSAAGLAVNASVEAHADDSDDSL